MLLAKAFDTYLERKRHGPRLFSKALSSVRACQTYIHPTSWSTLPARDKSDDEDGAEQGPQELADGHPTPKLPDDMTNNTYKDTSVIRQAKFPDHTLPSSIIFL